jgi:hypothetical protein
MPSFIAESYLPRSRRADAASLAERARQAAETLAGTGRDVAYLRSAFLPEDELCLHWFAAWGAETRSCCGGGLVLVDEAAEQVASLHPKFWRLRVGPRG